MRARSSLILFAALTAACGSKPPAGPSGTSTTVVRAGDYTVFVAATSGFSAGTPVTCFVSNSGGTATASESISFSATVTAANGTFTLRPTGAANMGMVVSFTSAGAGTIAGPVSGQVLDATTGTVVTFGPLAANTIPGSPAADATFIGFNTLTSDPNVFSGSVTGAVTMALGGSSRFCAGSTWMMRPL